MATLDCSYELLCKTERSVLRQLAIFVGSSSPDEARAILTHDGPIKLVPSPEVFKPTDAVGKARLPNRCVLHGLRKAAARRMAEAGATPHRIAAVTGHKSLKEIERYTKMVSQRGLAVEAISKIGERNGL
jgi:integrase